MPSDAERRRGGLHAHPVEGLIHSHAWGLTRHRHEGDVTVLDLTPTEDDGPTRAGRAGDSQPLPTPNDAPDIQSQVIADIEKRRQVGIERYGTALQPNNGRNALLDLYEELIDAVMYAKQRLVEERQIRTVRVVFDGPPGPEPGTCCFVETETPEGEGIKVGRWVELPGGRWALELEARA